jgi:hypothetical protein
MAMKPVTLIIVGVVVVLVGLMAYSTTLVGGFKVEVCKTYQGHEACGIGVGTTEQEAMTTATGVACAKISSGMTESNQCQMGNPTKVNWLKGR